MEYTIEPRVPGVRPQDPPDYDGITFVYVFTTVLTPWIQPPVNGEVTLVVANAQGFVAGMTIVIENAGYYEVVSTDALNRMTVINFGTDYNVPPGTGIDPGKVTTTSLPGPPGGIGPPGPEGPDGPPGPPLNAKGTVATVSDLPATGNIEGDFWTTADTGESFVWSGSAWIDMGQWTGDTGSQGPIGPRGAMGPQGNPGPVGPTGPQGSQGPAGGPGPSGPQGSQGPVGPQGPKGNDGTSVVIKGSVATHADLPTTGNTIGDLWIALDTSHGWVWSAGNIWADVGPIQGPAGPAGAAGPTGAPGAAATIAVGTTSTGAAGSAAAVTNVGSSSAAVFNFAIPQGVAGTAGPQGVPGNEGDQGPQGPQGIPGAAGSPGAQGPQGAAGTPSWTLVGAGGFTVPAYGQSINVPLADTSWIALGEWVYINDAGGPGVAGQMVVTAKTPTQVTLFNPTPATYPLATTVAPGLLTQLSGNTTDFVDGTNTCRPIAVSTDSGNLAIIGSDKLISVPQQTLWYQRLRSFNAVGNSNFEVDQRNVGNSFGIYNAANTPAIDRWISNKASTATMIGSVQQMPANPPIMVPGTSFAITSKFWRVTLTGQQTSLAAGDYHTLFQYVEGPQWRELCSDVHSVSLLVRSSVAGLIFGLLLKDPVASTKTLSKLCTISAANTWTLIQLPNLPVWPSGNFVTTPGSNGYQLLISLACGSTLINPTNDIWQSFAGFGAPGQSNFAASPVNSTFDIAFVQHEPGLLCSTLIDKPFTQNYDESLRYYQKTYLYGAAAGAVSSGGMNNMYVLPSAHAYTPIPFIKPMAKAPSIGIWNPADGSNSLRNYSSSQNQVSGGPVYPGDRGYGGVLVGGTAPASNWVCGWHHTADTGW
jgi:hypothetical protein